MLQSLHTRWLNFNFKSLNSFYANIISGPCKRNEILRLLHPTRTNIPECVVNECGYGQVSYMESCYALNGDEGCADYSKFIGRKVLLVADPTTSGLICADEDFAYECVNNCCVGSKREYRKICRPANRKKNVWSVSWKLFIFPNIFWNIWLNFSSRKKLLLLLISLQILKNISYFVQLLSPQLSWKLLFIFSFLITSQLFSRSCRVKKLIMIRSTFFTLSFAIAVSVTVGQFVYPESDTNENRKPSGHVRERSTTDNKLT